MQPPGDQGSRSSLALFQAKLLGPFVISLGDKIAGPWERPPAKRICELVLVSPERRVGKEEALEALWPRLSPAPASKALSQALSYAGRH